MNDVAGRERCGRCGANPFASSGSRSHWIWVRTDEGPSALAMHMCAPCSREFGTSEEREQYLRLALLA